jgi:hypothetical protein
MTNSEQCYARARPSAPFFQLFVLPALAGVLRLLPGFLVRVLTLLPGLLVWILTLLPTVVWRIRHRFPPLLRRHHDRLD